MICISQYHTKYNMYYSVYKLNHRKDIPFITCLAPLSCCFPFHIFLGFAQYCSLSEA